MTISIPVTHPFHKVLSMDVTDTVNRYRHTVVKEVIQHVSENYIFMVGMAWKEVIKRIGTYEYNDTHVEYGAYLSLCKERLPIQMGSSYETFPLLFVQGILMGGLDDLKALIEKESISTVVGGWSS